MKIFTALVLSGLVFLITGCLSDVRMPLPEADFSCEVILYSPFPDFVGKSFAVTEALDLIETNWGIERENIRVGTSGDITSVSWQKDGVRNSLNWERDIFNFAFVSFEVRAPTVRRVAECIGADPEWYQAYHYTHSENALEDYEVNYWFPLSGIVTRTYGSAPAENSLPRIDASLTVRSIYIFVPGSPQQMLANVAYPIVNADYPLLKPWPGSWELVQFEKE